MFFSDLLAVDRQGGRGIFLVDIVEHPCGVCQYEAILRTSLCANAGASADETQQHQAEPQARRFDSVGAPPAIFQHSPSFSLYPVAVHKPIQMATFIVFWLAAGNTH